jgi:periplasmic copper chaperone A
MRRTIPAVIAAVALCAPAAAGAHVTLQPDSAPAGGFARLDVRVPNERDDAGTVKVAVQMPPGVATASYEPVPGWTVKVTRERLDEPIDVHGEPVTEQVSRVTWTGDPRAGGIIAPGQFQDFGLSLRVPDGDAGQKLTFKALQTYESGEVVRWIGPEESDEPAPLVEVLEAPPEGEEAAATPAPAPAAQAEGGGGAAAEEDEGGSDTLSVIALIVGAIGLILGLVALLRRGGGRPEPVPAREERKEEVGVS